MASKRKKTKQQEILDECETSRDYYYAVLNAKKDNEEWAVEIPLDLVPQRGEQHKCLLCGNPNMEDSLTGSECRLCGQKRLKEVYSLSSDEAILEYELRIKGKQRSQEKYEKFVKEKYAK